MWTMPVVVIDVLGEYGFELAPVEDEHRIEALPTDSSHESFGEGVRPRGSNGRTDDPYLLGSEDLVETGRELGIPVAHKKPDRIKTIGKHHGQVAGLLDHPRSSRVGADPVYVDPSRVELDKEEHREATQQHRVDREEVARQHR